jgi:hypothetical protein
MAKFIVNLTWDDAPHLSEEAKKEMLASCLPHERDARSKGLPQLGSGAIYPIVEDDIVIKPFELPDNWPRAAGMDVGWKKTAGVWGAYDPKADTWYLYSEYYKGYAEPSIHADAMSSRGRWMPIAVDCHSDRHSEAGAMGLLTIYENFGLNVCKADNGAGTLEPSLLEVYQRLSSGRIKIFAHLTNLRGEFRVYRRDLNGRIVKENDHLMDAMRYLIMTGTKIMELQPPEDASDGGQTTTRRRQGGSSICGY